MLWSNFDNQKKVVEKNLIVGELPHKYSLQSKSIQFLFIETISVREDSDKKTLTKHKTEEWTSPAKELSVETLMERFQPLVLEDEEIAYKWESHMYKTFGVFGYLV